MIMSLKPGIKCCLNKHAYYECTVHWIKVSHKSIFSGPFTSFLKTALLLLLIFWGLKAAHQQPGTASGWEGVYYNREKEQEGKLYISGHQTNTFRKVFYLLPYGK